MVGPELFDKESAVVAVAALVADVAEVAVVAFPFKAAVIVPAEKLPLPSLATNVLAVLVEAFAVVAEEVKPKFVLAVLTLVRSLRLLVLTNALARVAAAAAAAASALVSASSAAV
jgi:hypothetical protein